MSTFGLIGLVIAFASVAVSVVCLLAGYVLGRKKASNASETLLWGGGVAALITAIALTVCCGILVYCFMVGDMTIEYVLMEHSDATGPLGVLYRFSGLWAGREGSLLFWAWLISLFNCVVAVRAMKGLDHMDCMALFISDLVLAAFVAVCLFSEENMPFIATAATFFDENGNLNAMAQSIGMNPLLEHWAQAIHPPTLFIGYAGLTIPFAYAIAALIVNDPSKKWVERATRFAMFSWLFLGIGIGLGAVWAYVVLGWGGYWGWDPVENASLLSWMVALALIHSFTVYRQRGAFKRWSVMCACLAFAFVVVGTFITRSGVVQSVHAFEGDPVSLVLFGSLIGVSVLMGIVGLVIRWKPFGPGENDAIESLASRESAYYFNNVIMVVFTFLLCYLTVSSALPTFLPFGGQSLSAGTYNAIARPLGVVYCLIVALCPLLAWSKTDRAKFVKQARIPAACALVLFVVLMVYYVTTLYPAYDAIIAAGGIEADELLSEGPVWYYNGLAILGFAVASLLFFNTLFMIGRAARTRAKATGTGAVQAFFGGIVHNASRFGGYIAHFAMAIILVGLIGSSMFVTEKVSYIEYDEASDTAQAFFIDDYELRYTGNSVTDMGNGDDILYMVEFDVFDANSGSYIGHVSPSVQLVSSTQQTKLNASVISFPTEDLFVVYRGVSSEGDLSMDVRVNPLVSFTWVGFALLVVGTAIGAFGRRKEALSPADQAEEKDAPSPAEASASGASAKVAEERRDGDNAH